MKAFLKSALLFLLSAGSWLFDLAVLIAKAIVVIVEGFFFSRLFRLLLWFSYFYEQNAYYGWHKTPANEMELATDGIHVLLLMLALMPIGNSKTVVKINGEDITERKS